MVQRLVCLGVLSICMACLATTSALGQTLTAALERQYSGIGLNVDEAAELMPEELYSFRPAEAVRSFGELVGHVANAQFSMCAAAKEEPSPASANYEADVTAKADLVAAIKASTQYCHSAFAEASDDRLREVVDFYQGPTPVGAVLAFNMAHSNEHYGNMVTYLRIQGFVPPSTARTQ